MKTIRIIMALVLVCGLLFGLPVAAQAQDNEPLTLDRVIQVSDTELVLEFSEPVAINKFQANRGPYAAIRYVNATGAVGYALNEYNVNGDALQWHGDFSYIGEDHSKLLWKIGIVRFGCDTIAEAANCTDADVRRSIEKNKLELKFVLEEVPFDETVPAADGKVENVTTEDGNKYLFPTYPKGWESCVMEIEKNYNYPIDRNSIRGVNSATQDWDFDVIWKGEGLVAEETTEPSVETVRVLKNDPAVIALIFAADILVAAAAVLVVVLILKKKKGKAA